MPSLAQRLARVGVYLRGSRGALAAAFAAILVSAATEPLIPALLQPLLDKGFAGQSLPLWSIPLAILVLFAVRGAAGFLAQYLLAWATNLGVLELRRAMFSQLMRAEPGLFGRQSASQLTNTVVYEVQQGASWLVHSLLTFVRDSFTLLALLGYLMWLNWRLTLFVAVLFPAVALVMRALGRRLHRLTLASQSATDDLAYTVEENVLAWRIVRLHEAEPAQSQRFEARSRDLRGLLQKTTVAAATMTPVTQLLAAAALSAVITLAVWQGTQGGATVGSFVAFVTAMLMLVSPIKHLSDVMGPITRGLAAVERGLDLVERVPAERGGTHVCDRCEGRIEWQGVGVRYAAEGRPALDGIELSVEPGETVALVGASGSGKSTLVHLLPRFIDPSSGQVRLDGVPLGQWEVHSLRRQFALVSQDVVLFNDTIAANVALGAQQDGKPDEARVRAALQAAQLLEFGLSQPDGLDTVIGHNGSKLSGGQRQRLAIARALYKDAPVLILDEATSALDSESERAVQDALDVLMKGRTSLVIAHRLSTIERADRVIVLEEGRIVEQGTHAQLLGSGGVYARLHAMQFRR